MLALIPLRASCFVCADTENRGELDDVQAMMMLESRGEAKSLTEIRELVQDIDLDRNRKLSFL